MGGGEERSEHDETKVIQSPLQISNIQFPRIWGREEEDEEDEEDISATI
jgi:hypothetical protein